MSGARPSDRQPGSERGGPADSSGSDNSLSLLWSALGRVIRSSCELARLELQAAQRNALVLSRLVTLAWVCLGTGWLLFNAGVVLMAAAWLGVDTGLMLLLAALVNGLLATIMLWFARDRWQQLKRSRLRVFLG